jgi:uncharacterized protein
MAQPLPAHRKKQLVTKQLTVPANFELACRDFNAGRFFDAHESLEEIWQFERGPVRDLYKGLIQIAAGFVHISRANADGADRLLSTAIAHLAPYRPLGAMGWDVERIASDTEEALRRVRDLSPVSLAEFDLTRRPGFEFDRTVLRAEARRWSAWGFDPDGNVLDMEITVAV